MPAGTSTIRAMLWGMIPVNSKPAMTNASDILMILSGFPIFLSMKIRLMRMSFQTYYMQLCCALIEIIKINIQT